MNTKHDLLLVCRADVKISASSDQLMKASSNIAFKEIIATALKERQDAEVAVLRVPSDAHFSWSSCLALLHDPKNAVLSWGDLLDVLRLADKYELKSVLEACEDRLLSDALKKPYTYVKLAGQVPWQQHHAADSSRACVDIALQLKTSCSLAAYKAFMTYWATGMLSLRYGTDRLVDYNERLKKASEFLCGVRPTPEQEVTADMLYLLGSRSD